MMLLRFSILIIFTIVKGEIDNLEVKHIEEIVSKQLKDVFKYKLPENANQYRAINHTTKDYGTFDYIIVGAGSAGAVLATRLSENENLQILLLEAGGHQTTFTEIPAMIMHLQGTEFNWNFKTTPQRTSCLGMFDRRCLHPRGKGLGGTSIINALMYVRGNKNDFDNWARAGNIGWCYEEVLPYFIKSENSQIDGDNGYHGKGGLLNVEYHKPESPLLQAFLDANQQLGRKLIDYNGYENMGVGRTQINTLNGRRHSTGTAFLETAYNRKNLKILTHSYAKKVLIDNRRHARGVLFDHNGQEYCANANKDTILSAGAFGSPHLLMLSGIGPANVLNSVNIPTIVDLPVGENYQDHPTYFALFFTTSASQPVTSLYENSRDYLNGIGAFTIAANAQGVGFLRTKSATTPEGVPNIEVILITQNVTNDFFQRAYNYNHDSYNTYWTQLDATKTFSFFIMLLHPKSTGTVRLQSSNPYAYPIIDSNFLSDEFGQDIEEMYEGIQSVIEMMETPAFRKVNGKLFYRVLPACSNFPYLSKEQWFCNIRQLTSHIYHPVGTCKMAPHPFVGGVVDHELKVHGVSNLRVVDASIIPESTSGHINAPTIMIAEKIAEQLKYS